MTSLGSDAFAGEAKPLYHVTGERKNGVHSAVALKRAAGLEVAHKCEARHPEKGMKHICHVSRSIRDAALVCVLAQQDKLRWQQLD